MISFYSQILMLVLYFISEAGISALELRLIDKETAKELIPKLGDRLRFLNALQGYKNPDVLINNLMVRIQSIGKIH